MFKRIIGSRTVMGVIIGIFLVGFYLLGYVFSPYFMDAFIAFVMFLCINEMRIALRQHFTKAIENLLIVYSATIVFPYIFLGFIGVVYFTLSIFVIGASIVLFDKKCPPTAIQNMALIYLYPGLAMSSLLFINGSFLNYLGIAVVLLTSLFTDMFAMFVGMLFGKHKLAAEISPKKTIEGAIGGLFGGVIGAGIVFLLFEVLGWLSMGLTAWGLNSSNMYLAYGLLSIFCAAFTQIGDLLASYFKRQWGIKDFSKLLGNHGGVLDRFDGIMLNSCFVSLIFAFII